MAGPPVRIATFRRLAKLLTFTSVAATVAGFYAALRGVWGLAGLAIGAGILCLYAVQRLSIQAQPGSERVLVFVTKDQCSLCDEARLLLPGILEGTSFTIEEVRLESDRFLRRHFKDKVPALLWQGEVVAQLKWEPEAVRARLRELPVAPTGQQSP